MRQYSIGLGMFIALALSACGGEGTETSSSSLDNMDFFSATVGTNGNTYRLTLNYTASASANLPPPTAFRLTSDGIEIPVAKVGASINGAYLDFGSLDVGEIQAGQKVLLSYTAPPIDNSKNNFAIQNLLSGVDAAGFTDKVIHNGINNVLPIAFTANNTIANPSKNSDGEYQVSAPMRVTVTNSLVTASSQTSTVDLNGASTSTSSNIHSLTSGKYDVTFVSAPSGGLTTVKISLLGQPKMVIKLRWS